MALTFEAKKKPRTMARVTQRRQKIVAGIDQQTCLLDQYRQGISVKSAWYWEGEDGLLFLSVRYGRSEVELAKGMYSVVCADTNELAVALKELRSMVLAGKLDDALQKASDKLRAKFKAE